MFIPNREEPFIILFFPFLHLRGLGFLPHVFQVFELFPRARQKLVVDMLFRRDDEIAEQLDRDRQEIAAYPVENDARCDVDAEEKRNKDGKPVRDFLRQSALFPLKRIDPVLHLTENKRGKPRRKWQNETPSAFLDRNDSQRRILAGFRDLMNDRDKSHQDDDLRDERNQTQKRMVMFLLENLLLFLRNRVFIAEMLNLDSVYQWHDLHHGHGILLTP